MSTTTYHGHTIERRVIGYAYPRNGNLGNPTPRVRWFVGDVMSSSLREAKAFIDEYLIEEAGK